MSMHGRPALLVLESGEMYEGWGWGKPGTAVGEVVFNTALTGYQEVLTDPSYAGQLVTMTYPHIGNYGVNPTDMESARVQPAGFIARDPAARPSNFRSQAALDPYLKRAGITAIAGIDTRALTRRIRSGGAVMGLIAHEAGPADAPSLVARLQALPKYGDIDFVERVSCDRPLRARLGPAVRPGEPAALLLEPAADRPVSDPSRHVVVMDFGAKYSILKNLLRRGFEVTLVPSSTPAADVERLGARAVLLSNGPGDPARLGGPIEEIRHLLGRVPLYGICLGHQLLGQAFGASTFKLKYGHRGANQPVLDARTGRVVITSQNHGYAVDPAGLPADVEVTHQNLNDGTVEGLSHRGFVAKSVQYHPEAGPGPSDGAHFFDDMADELLERR